MTHQDNDQTTDQGAAKTETFPAESLDQFDTSADAEAGVLAVEQMPSGSALLVVKRGPNAGARFPLDQRVTSVGRHPASDIFLDDATASRRHAEFRRVGDRFEVVDMGSLNGTYVNGKPLHSGVVLANGDQIQIVC